MIEPSYEEFRRDFTVAGRNRMRLIIPVLILVVTIAAGAAAFWQFYRGGFSDAIVARQDNSSETAPVARDLDTSQQQSTDQVQALQQDLVAQQAATRRLSDEVDALTTKVDALQQSFASAPVTVGRAPPPRRKPPPVLTTPLSIRP
jgi:uncharacterized coiled-coil protein SlyX